MVNDAAIFEPSERLSKFMSKALKSSHSLVNQMKKGWKCFVFLGSAAPRCLPRCPFHYLLTLCHLVGYVGLDHAVSPVQFVPRWVGLMVKEES